MLQGESVDKKPTIPLWSDDSDVESFATLMGWGRNKTYDLAHKGLIPGVKKVGLSYIAMRRPIDRFLDGEDVPCEADLERNIAVVN